MLMKHHLLLLLALCLPLGAWSAPITQRQAFAQAQKFFSAHGIALPAKAKAFMSPQTSAADTTVAAWYVFNAGDDKGFAIVSGDDRTEPVLGYSLTGTLSEDNMPDNMRSWLQSYADQIEYIQKNNISISRAPSSSTERPRIPEMMTTKWNQTEPYNNSCPNFFSNGKSVTGCVATAMSQVLYYQYQQHQGTITRQTTAEIPSYYCSSRYTSGQIHVDAVAAGSTIDWANMLPQYGSSVTDAQKTAVANLMFWSGAAVQMNYRDAINGGSSASATRVPEALVNYFGFDASTRYVSRDASYTNKQWNDLVYNELANHRVVLYGGQSSAGSGHAFVINGYDENNYFYVNWGWGGTGDGAYLLSVLSPEGSGTGAGTVGSGYNQTQEIVINAEPNHGGTAPLRAKALNFTRSGNTLSYQIQNIGLATASFNYGFGAVASDGTITTLGTTSTTSNLATNYLPNNAKTLNLATLANGTYDIVPIAKLTSETTWQSLWPAGHAIRVTVSNGTVTFGTEAEASISATSLATNGAMKAGRAVNVTTTLSNTGDGDYEGVLYLFASTTSTKGTAAATQSAGLMAGNSAAISVSWTPTSAGTYTLWLCSDSNGSNVLATLENVVIEEGNGQYAMTLNSMTVDNVAATSTTDSEGRTVTNVSGNDLTGSYTLTANQTVATGTHFCTFILKYNETTGQYDDYNVQAYPNGMSVSSSSSALSQGTSITISFSATNLPDGRYIIRPEVGTLQASSYYYMSPELWYDDSHVYVIGAATGITAPQAGKPQTVTVYNLQGVKVATISSDQISTLPHGIYIVNGKKMVVK